MASFIHGVSSSLWGALTGTPGFFTCFPFLFLASQCFCQDAKWQSFNKIIIVIFTRESIKPERAPQTRMSSSICFTMRPLPRFCVQSRINFKPYRRYYVVQEHGKFLCSRGLYKVLKSLQCMCPWSVFVPDRQALLRDDMKGRARQELILDIFIKYSKEEPADEDLSLWMQ